MQFIFCLNSKLFVQILNDIKLYAIKHKQYQIEIEHHYLYDYILILYRYNINYIDNCMYCYTKYNISCHHKYYKNISNFSTARRIYSKEYDPNREYNVDPVWCDI